MRRPAARIVDRKRRRALFCNRCRQKWGRWRERVRSGTVETQIRSGQRQIYRSVRFGKRARANPRRWHIKQILRRPSSQKLASVTLGFRRPRQTGNLRCRCRGDAEFSLTASAQHATIVGRQLGSNVRPARWAPHRLSSAIEVVIGKVGTRGKRNRHMSRGNYREIPISARSFFRLSRRKNRSFRNCNWRQVHDSFACYIERFQGNVRSL